MKYYTRQVKEFKKGDIIFSENSSCDGMYIIDSGRVRVFKTIVTGNTKKEIELCTLNTKAMFGEMAMIDESRRSASVQAIEPTKCTVISKRIFEDQLSRIPTWMVNMIKILVSRLRETNEKLRKMVEQQSSIDLDDSGILTVDSEHNSDHSTLEKESTYTMTKLRSQEIINDLFEKEKT